MYKTGKGVRVVLTIALIVATIGILGITTEVKAKEDGTAMYRLYNLYTGEHIYTKDEGEKVRIYGTSDEKSGKVRDVAVFAPSDGTFIFLSGSFNLEDISKIMDK